MILLQSIIQQGHPLKALSVIFLVHTDSSATVFQGPNTRNYLNILQAERGSRAYEVCPGTGLIAHTTGSVKQEHESYARIINRVERNVGNSPKQGQPSAKYLIIKLPGEAQQDSSDTIINQKSSKTITCITDIVREKR